MHVMSKESLEVRNKIVVLDNDNYLKYEIRVRPDKKLMAQAAKTNENEREKHMFCVKEG